MGVWLKCRFQLIPFDAPQSAEYTKPVKVNKVRTAAAEEHFKNIINKNIKLETNAIQQSLCVIFPV